MIQFDDLNDNEWALIEGLFATQTAQPTRSGRPRTEIRTIVNAVLWTLSTGRGWGSLPGWYPSRPTCLRRFEEWLNDGTLAEMLKRLASSGRHVPLRGPIGAAVERAASPRERERVVSLSWTGPQMWRAPLEVA
jgi:putative transposase